MLDNKKDGIIVQAGILAMATVISRIIGLLYTSPLTAIIGDTGNGYYSAAYQIYVIVLLISSFSIPSAMAKILSQKMAVGEYRNAQRIFHCVLVYVIVVGAIASAILYFFADRFVMGNSVTVLKVFAPTVFLSGLLGSLRGFFQAQKTMVPTSVSQIVEQMANALVSVGGAYLLMQMVAGTSDTNRAMYGAIGSALGTGSGVLIGLIFMFVFYQRHKSGFLEKVREDKHKELPVGPIFIMIFSIVTPFILSTCIYNVSSFLNYEVFSNILVGVKGMDYDDVARSYGIYARKALVITNLPIALSSAMASAMIPNISSSFAKGDLVETEATVKKAMRAIMMVTIPSAAGLIVLARPIIYILFPQKTSLDEAATVMMVLAVTVIFYSISTLSNAVLQGVGRVNIPVVNALVALVLQTAVLGILLLTTDVNSYGLAIAAICYSFVMCILNSLALKKKILIKLDITKTYVIPVISALIMGIVAFIIYDIFDILFMKIIGREYFANLFAVCIAVVVSMIVYALLMIALKGATETEIIALPKGVKIAKFLKKVHLLK
ncbi:MAG: polysaccharide biosynthesis protein [Butyrivibrio sp.]|nr:polysaccharide biosynthesis protein [Butyrivibrio sp.]